MLLVLFVLVFILHLAGGLREGLDGDGGFLYFGIHISSGGGLGEGLGGDGGFLYFGIPVIYFMIVIYKIDNHEFLHDTYE